MNKNKKMKGGITSRLAGLWFLAVVLSFSPINHPVQAEPEPIPASLSYAESYADDAENYVLFERLKQIAEGSNEMIERARELSEERMEVEAILDGKARRNQRVFSAENPETLPIPSAIVHHGPAHSGKRTNYMAPCHFKICNMGRKRQF